MNPYDVVIGDSKYNSENSPLNNWSDEVDPAIMAGDEWIHPTNDIVDFRRKSRVAKTNQIIK